MGFSLYMLLPECAHSIAAYLCAPFVETVTTASRPVSCALIPADMLYFSILAAHAESSDSSAFGGRQQIAFQKSRYQGASAGCHAQA